MLIGLIAYPLRPSKDISVVERRFLETFDRVIHPDYALSQQESSNYTYHEYVFDRLEAALKDQFPGRGHLVIEYNNLTGEANYEYASLYGFLHRKYKMLRAALDPNADNPVAGLDFVQYPQYGYALLPKNGVHQYPAMPIGNFFRLNNTDWVSEISSTQNEEAKKNVQILNNMVQSLLEKYQLHVYYALFTASEDTGWFSDVSGTAYFDWLEYIAQEAPADAKCQRLVFKDFNDFSTCFFKTDHHMNYIGSRRFYEMVYNMMAPDLALSPMKTPVATIDFTKRFGVRYYGSRSNTLGTTGNYDKVYDNFIVDVYDTGNYTGYCINPNTGKQSEVRFGLLDRYLEGDINNDPQYNHYIHFYGYDSTDKFSDKSYVEVIINNDIDQHTTHNLLYIGDSTQRPVRMNIASHMRQTVWLDYRILNKVNLDDLIQKYNIDTLLIGGKKTQWCSNIQQAFIED